VIGTLLRTELRMLLRDTRTVLIAVVAPLVILPLYILGANWVESREEERLEEETYEVAVTGERAAWARGLLDAALAVEASRSPGGEEGAVPSLVPVPDEEEGTVLPAAFQRVEAEEPDSLLEEGALDLLVVGRSPAPEDSLKAEVPVLELRYRARSDFSRNARDRMEERLRRIRADTRDSLFRAAGFPVPVDRVAVFESRNVASAEKTAGSFLGGVLVPFLIILMMTGGSIVAADSISGEKERGTLETLLTTAVSRTQIVHAKLAAIMAVGLAVALVNLVNLAVYIGLGILDLPENLQISMGPGTLGALLLLMLPLVVLVAATLLLLSGVAQTYKEYQIYFLPVWLVVTVLGFAAFLPGMELRSAVVLVPVSGIAVATRALLMGDGSLLWGAMAVASTACAGWLLLARTEAALSNERLITSAGPDEADFRGGAALFPRHVLRWFVGFWVVFFLASLWLGETLGIRGQVVVNLVGIFFGGSILLIGRYGLDVRETLQLYTPHWRAWPAVLVGAPSLLVLAVGLSQLVNAYLFPVPDRLVEAFGESLTADLPLWQLVLFITVMPGVFEEIAFRGVLFSGLRKQLRRPWAAVLVSALVFGLFHVSLFRILPTAFLGVVLALVVLRTGSLYPAVLWHFLNNFLALVPAELGWISLDPSEGVAYSWYAAAVLGAGVSWLLMRERPGQRPPEPAGRPPS
jgi:sodium transport system permease protein